MASRGLEQLNSDDILCKKVLQELLKNQSVASWAASALQQESRSRCTSESRQGVPIIGRNGQDSKPDYAEAPQLDQTTLAALYRSLVTDKSSDNSSDTSSETSSMTSITHLQRSHSISGDLPPVKTMNMDRFKTELCRQFQETGFCKYGAKCQFAHGRHEVRSVSRHMKYKTEMCRTYHTTGICPYGTRCHFIHDEEEMTSKVPARNHQSLSRHRSHPVSAAMRFNPAVGSYTDLSASLGSVGDLTPPSSISSSPAPSPTPACFPYDDEEEERTKSLPIKFLPPPGFSAPPRMKSSTPQVFTFTDVPMATAESSPLDINIPAFNPVNSLAAGLQSINPSFGKDLMTDCFKDMYYAPSSPPLCAPDSDSEGAIESPMDISRNLRLPIFSQLSKESGGNSA